MLKRSLPLLTTLLGIIALSWGVMVQPVYATDLTASISFNPPLTNPNSLQVGNTFEAIINLNSAGLNPNVDTLGFYMTFDQTAVQVNNITNTSNQNLCVLPVTADNATGTTEGACISFGGIPVADEDVLTIEFEVLQTNRTFDLSFVECATPTSINCFGAYSSSNNQIGTYVNATDQALAVTLSDMGISPETQSQGAMAFAVLMFVTTAVLLWMRRNANN